MLKIIIFIVVSLGIIIYSWPSLRNRHSHGFYRFFAFESILILLLLNVQYWFYHPFTIRQIISWVLLLSSLFWVVFGVYQLRVVGKPKDLIEDTTVLVTVGVYKYVRHPLYSSLLFLAWGIFLKHPSLLGAIIAMVISASIVATGKNEEAENLKKFGKEYSEHIKSSKMFIPFLF